MGDKVKALQYAKTRLNTSGAVLDGKIETFISNCKDLKFPIMLKLSGAGGEGNQNNG